MIDIQKFMDENKKWSDEVFQDATAKSCLNHLKKEIGEVLIELNFKGSNEDIKVEMADCYLLFLQTCSHLAISFEEINDIAVDKMQVNRSRDWGKKNEDGFYEHVK